MQIFIEFVIGSFLMTSLSPDDYGDLKMTRVLRELRGPRVSHVTRSQLSPRVTHLLASSANDGYRKSVTSPVSQSSSIFPVSQDAGFIPAARVLSSLTKLSPGPTVD